MILREYSSMKIFNITLSRPSLTNTPQLQSRLLGTSQMKANWPIVKIDDMKANVPNALAMGPFGSNITKR